MEEQDKLDHSYQYFEKKKPRPVAVTAFCIAVGLLLLGQGYFLVRSLIPMPDNKQFLSLQMLSVANTLVACICVIGLWQMKKWSVYIYIPALVLYYVLLTVMHGYWSMSEVAIPVLGILVAIKFFKEMD